MAWKERCVMDERVRFLADVLKKEWSMAELCRRYGISRRVGYKTRVQMVFMIVRVHPCHIRNRLMNLSWSESWSIRESICIGGPERFWRVWNAWSQRRFGLSPVPSGKFWIGMVWFNVVRNVEKRHRRVSLWHIVRTPMMCGASTSKDGFSRKMEPVATR